MNRDAIFSDGTSQYRNPAEPKPNESVFIKIRINHGTVVMVSLLGNNGEVPMGFVGADGEFDYYGVSVTMTDADFAYVFKIQQENEIVYYDRYGCSDYERRQYAFAIKPGYSTPEWSKGAVMYQIMVDRFCNGDTSNDVLDREYAYINRQVERVENWSKVPNTFGVAEFYGGDIEGVMQKLYYLKSLGVDVVYFNPIFVSPSNHKYDTSDYDYVDPHYGKIIEDGGDVLYPGDMDNSHATRYKNRVTDIANLKASNALFIDFVNKAHGRGMKVILDGVFNHCGSFNKWLDREKLYDQEHGYVPGAYRDENSPYRNFFSWHDETAWPDNKTYDGWWGHDTLPKLNYEGSDELHDTILNIGRKWVSAPYNCDGWRLDVAADLGHSPEYNHKFWREFRDAVKEANPNAIILAEHYGDASSWLDGTQWDTIMNYDAFMEPVSYFLTGMEKHSDAFDGSAIGDGVRFRDTMLHNMTMLRTPALLCSMNQLDNHDHSRFLTRTNHKVGRVDKLGARAAEEDVSIPIMKQAIMMQMTWPGAPTLYYGDEAGVCGFTDPDNRRTYPWGDANYELIDYYRDMIGMHKQSFALRRGSFKFLECGKGFVSYGRFTANEQVVTVVNTTESELDVDVSVWLLGVPKESVMSSMARTNERGYSIMSVDKVVKDGKIHLSMPPHSGIVLQREA